MLSGRLFRALHLPPSLGFGAHPNFVAMTTSPRNGAEGFTDKFFVQQGAIDLSGIEECDAPLHGGVQKGNHLVFVLWRPVGPTHSHAAKSDGRYFQIPNSKFAGLHCDYSQNLG